uniref:Uncharacterized protein n=1 Tax=Rhizophora mucronata TaxID=61149 RepID=A0A2P2INN1_RHIMU
MKIPFHCGTSEAKLTLQIDSVGYIFSCTIDLRGPCTSVCFFNFNYCCSHLSSAFSF